MPEMPDVVLGETIASEWGNDIRDRTLQRYASAAARTSAIPSPNAGDLSYLADSDTLYFYSGSAWVQLALIPVTAAMLDSNAVTTAKIVDANVTGNKILDGNVTQGKLSGSIAGAFLLSNGTTGSPTITTTETSVLTTTLPIPAGWGSWKFLGWSTGLLSVVGSVNSVNVFIRVDSTDAPITSYDFLPDGNSMPLAVSFSVSGLTTTGTRTVALRAQKSGAGGLTAPATQLTAMAIRES